MHLRSLADWWAVVRRRGVDPRLAERLHPGPLSREQLDRLEEHRRAEATAKKRRRRPR